MQQRTTRGADAFLLPLKAANKDHGDGWPDDRRRQPSRQALAGRGSRSFPRDGCEVRCARQSVAEHFQESRDLSAMSGRVSSAHSPAARRRDRNTRRKLLRLIRVPAIQLGRSTYTAIVVNYKTTDSGENLKRTIVADCAIFDAASDLRGEGVYTYSIIYLK